MVYFFSDSNDVHYNLALEEHLFKNSEEEFFFLWVNKSCVVVGRNQNTMAEINYDYIRENNIKVARRITGGGAVYHDVGNLNFSFIKNKDNLNFKDGAYDFSYFGGIMVNALKTLDLDVKLDGRNDILLGDKKISGNAQSVYKDRVLHHGTLLIDVNLEVLQAALNVAQDKLEGKGVKSVRSRVTNIRAESKEEIKLDDVVDLIFREIALSDGNEVPIREDVLSSHVLGDEVKNAVEQLYQSQNSTWEWNFGESPKYNFQKAYKFDKGKIQSYLMVENGYIVSAGIYGDFFGDRDIAELENALINVRHEYDAIMAAIEGFEVDNFIFGASPEILAAGLI